MDVIEHLKRTQDAQWKRIDANDWLYQSWAYDAHNVGTTQGFNGDYKKALRSIKAKVLIMAGS
jgi:homoserine O-acetyltransferase